MGASYRLSSSNLFLRSAGKNRVSVVKLIKDHVESGVVGKEDWEVMETIGINMSCDSLEIFDYNIVEGEELKRLALYLCMSRLWVNKEGDCFIHSMGITSMFYKISQLFDWSAYGVENVKSSSSDHHHELKIIKDELKAKEKQIDELKAERYRCLQGKRDELKAKDKEIAELRKELDNNKIKDIQVANLRKNIERLVAQQVFRDELLYNCRMSVDNYKVIMSGTCFKMQTCHQSHHPDFNTNPMITLTRLNDYKRSIYYPRDVKVYVDDGHFDEEYWCVVPVEHENSNTYEESAFAYFIGESHSSVDKFYKKILDGEERVRIPHREQASCSASVQFRVVLLRGTGYVYGFFSEY